MPSQQELEEALVCVALKMGSREDRAAFLDLASAGDLGLRRRLDDLITERDLHHLQIPGKPDMAASPKGEAANELAGEVAGTKVGSFTMRENIGDGGFGVVYKA